MFQKWASNKRISLIRCAPECPGSFFHESFQRSPVAVRCRTCRSPGPQPPYAHSWYHSTLSARTNLTRPKRKDVPGISYRNISQPAVAAVHRASREDQTIEPDKQNLARTIHAFTVSRTGRKKATSNRDDGENWIATEEQTCYSKACPSRKTLTEDQVLEEQKGSPWFLSSFLPFNKVTSDNNISPQQQSQALDILIDDSDETDYPLFEEDFTVSDAFSDTDLSSTPESRPWATIRRKTDLSHVNIREREAAAAGGTPTITQPSTTTFRSNSGLRYILHRFMKQIPCDTTAAFIESLQNSVDIDRRLLDIFDTDAREFIHRREYQLEDVLAWTWVLLSPVPTRQIRRYIALAQDCRRQGLRQPPIFLPLQLLRLDHIASTDLRALWTEITTDFESNEDGALWDDISASILLIRTIRHARKVDIPLFRDLAAFAPKLLPYKYDDLKDKAQIFHVRKITHFYNRLLSLLALPGPQQPFRSVTLQQQAQLSIARFMYDCQPPIVINREGYRAFVQLQLRHAKTAEEQDWARVKSPSWPPWRRDQLGIHESIEYTGRYSRVMKVLQRMRESGYGPTEYEENAQILAGWDTDQSPTVQVRRVMYNRPMTWLRQLFKPKESDTPAVDHNTWTARVEATRTIREAWLSFYSYMEATRDTKRSINVYRAIFQKLLARPLQGQILSEALPGDGRETFPDPVSSRDLVYVPTEPPTPEELYSQMLQDGIRPAGRLLADLLRAAPTPEHASQYIKDSLLSETKQDVLLNAEKYPLPVIRSTLRQIPDYLVASFFKALLQYSNIATATFQRPGSMAEGSRSLGRITVTPFTYARQLLEISGISYLPAYHVVLTGLQQRTAVFLRMKPESAMRSVKTMSDTWDASLRIIELINKQQLVQNPAITRTVALIAQNLVIALMRGSHNVEPLAETMSRTIKCLFWFTLTGRPISEHDWTHREQFSSLRTIPARSVISGTLPGYKELEVLFMTFSILSDQMAVLSLLAWVCEAEKDAVFRDQHPAQRRQMMGAVRVALEGTWVTPGISGIRDDAFASEEQLWEAMIISDELGWATDEETEEVLQRRSAWIDSINKAVS